MSNLRTKRNWILPEEPRPLRLVNSIWAERQQLHDDLSDAADLSAWMLSAGFSHQRVVRASSVVQFQELRGAIRRLTAFVTSDERGFGAVDLDLDVAVSKVNDVAAQSPIVTVMKRSRNRLVRSDVVGSRSVQTALSTVAVEAIELLTGEHSHLITACKAPGCVLYFLRDDPRRNWCGDACGNRARVARHYQKSKL